MTTEIIIVFLILGTSVVFLVTEWMAMEVVALLVLGSLALTGLLKPAEALAGFSNPAVVTVWAIFIMSGGLTRTGVANVIGRFVLKMVGSQEYTIIIVLMVSAGVMSAFMNNVAVAALMLPVTMDIARHTNKPPSRLLMPLAYGSLLGGLTTQIGTPPNILISDALRDNGLNPFTLFDYTPTGLCIMIVGVLFVAFIGRRLLPVNNLNQNSSGNGKKLSEQYELQKSMFSLRIPSDSVIVGKTLAESRIGSILKLTVLGITREGRKILAPGSSEVLLAGDRLIAEGQIEQVNELHHWLELTIEVQKKGDIASLLKDICCAEISIPKDSLFTKKNLYEIGFHNRFGVNVLAMNRAGQIKRTDLQNKPLQPGDVLLVQGRQIEIEALKNNPDFDNFRFVEASELTELYHLHERLFRTRIPEHSSLSGKTLRESRLGDAVGMRVISIIRNDKLFIPDPEEKLEETDTLIVQGRIDDLLLISGLEELETYAENASEAEVLESEEIGMMEVILSPFTTLSGKSLRQLHFREKFGMNIIAVWREGISYTTGLRDMVLRFGDALLLYGKRENLKILGKEPDFLVLTQDMQEIPRIGKAKLSTFIMAATLLPVILGLVPISIAAVTGAAFMILTGCLTMDEAYRFIEWKAVFLIAGMLPLGTALDSTGAARLLAEGVVGTLGPFGPKMVMFGLVLLTFGATCFIPTSALVVLMAPIVLSTSASMNVAPYPFMMAVAMASSASFMTPISHPANILVMGPGGYRFIDYMKVGGLLTLVVLIMIMLVVPYFWPM